ncbi:MAG: 2-octaprenyl-6-methoxyphenyl hydroxylase [Woeseiaceae bacterium]
MTGAGLDNDYDIVIAGGGMIGASLALALSPLRLRVAVVEAVARSASSQPSFDDRSTALSRSTQRMFEAMGLWEQVAAASTPIHRIHVSESGGFGFAHLDAREQGVEAMGYVVINRVLGDVLQSALDDAELVDMRCPARVVSVDTGEDAAAAIIEDSDGQQQRLTCKLLVAADGANSTVRRMLGITASQVQYGQHAVIGNLKTEKALDNTAYERFTEQGPLALLPIVDHRAAFVWTVSEDNVTQILELDDVAFLEELQASFGHRLGRLSRVGTRAAYPLTLSKALRLTATRGVLVGNSAHGLHPVAAQGFNLGMRVVAALCDCIADARGENLGANDPGDANLLIRYADWRRDDQGKLVRITDGLVRLFASSSPPVRVLRNIGMLGFDAIPGVRSLFARQMMGLSGRLPRLSRGVPLR